MIRQVILSGSFFDAGVKKLDTAFSEGLTCQYTSLSLISIHSLVVVDSNLRFFKGGGDKDASLACASPLAELFAVMILNACAEQ